MTVLFKIIGGIIINVFLPSIVFSYTDIDLSREEKTEKKWIDESVDYRITSFKKIRCPSCHMEFYYIPGRDTPHTFWVRYEKEEREEDKKEPLMAEDIENAKQVSAEKDLLKEKKNISGFLKIQKDFMQSEMKGITKDIISKDKKELQKKVSLEALGRGKEYELRQKLVCPYDGYSFFPEGDILDIEKVKKNILVEEPSQIELSFMRTTSGSTPFELRQFGYDLFKGYEEERERLAEEEEGRKEVPLSALGFLKEVFISSQVQTPTFSPENFSKTNAVVPVSEDYILGPGDKLIINIWGSVQESMQVEVDREGKIILPKAGPLYVWGMTLKDAERRITELLNQFYANFKVDVSLSKLRNIQIFVIGEVKRPGYYSISSQSGIFQALYIAGGPTKLGSLRRIKLITIDNKSEEIDLYPYLLKGEGIGNIRLQSGDTIFIPPIGDVVAISGNVKRPAIYETKSEILLSDLLDFAGGITPTGNLQRLQVERIKDNERRVMVDMELKTASGGLVSFKDIKMQNGDFVIVSPIVRLKHNFVTILGNVENPGDYAWKEDLTVSGLIQRAKGLLPATHTYRAEIARVSRDRTREIIPVNLEKIFLGGTDEDVALKEWDILLIYSEAEVISPSYVEIDGAINRPGRYELSPGMKISDLIFKAGGVTSKDAINGAELFHIVPGEQPVVREISIRRIKGSQVSIDKDILLQTGDMLFIKSEPKLTERKMVTIKGEVRFPGTYPIIEGERLSDLIERAGGFTNEAFLYGAVFTRKSIKEMQEKMRRQFLEKEQRTIMEEQQAILMRAGGGISTEAVNQSIQARLNVIEFIASAELDGRMVITLRPVDELRHTKYDILLEDGDTLTIPHSPSAITVIGSVNNPTSLPFEVGRGIDYYIQKAGGLTKHADRSGIYVIRANGEAVSKFMMAKYVERGDTIVVPQEFKYWTPPGALLKDTVEILSRIAVGVGIIAALD